MFALPIVFMLVDRAIDSFFGAHTSNETIVRGRGTRAELDSHPDIRVLVIGDSSARHGVDTVVLTEELHIPAWNIGTWHGAFAGQATLISAELERGRKLDAVIMMHTENGMTLSFDSTEVVLSYYLSPHAIALWTELGKIEPSRALEWSWALLSPSYRDGKALENFTKSLFVEPASVTWTKLGEQRRKNAEQTRSYLEARGHGRLADRPEGPSQGDFDNFARYCLDNSGYRWHIHPDVQEWYDFLLDRTDAYGVTVFHVFTPRMHALLEHPHWASNVGGPTRAWAAGMAKKHPSFVLPLPDPFPMQADEYYDTADHLDSAGAARFSRELARVIGPMLASRAASTSGPHMLRPKPR